VLNLRTDVFYACTERSRSAVNERLRQAQSGKTDISLSLSKGYEPTVSISTKKMGDAIEIRISDNGNGIPKEIIDKVFQPFFTTKPTGQGTGLGLSMSYDIITKGHGGKLSLETKQLEGTVFSILLPIQ